MELKIYFLNHFIQKLTKLEKDRKYKTNYTYIILTLSVRMKLIYNLDYLESTKSLKSLSVRFEKKCNTLFSIIGKNTEICFQPH